MLACFNPYCADKSGKYGRNWTYSRKARLKSTPFPCGKCEACISKKRREWGNRLLLESSVFVGRTHHMTLTYDDEKLPADGNLSERDLLLFLKRFRINIKRKAPKNMRFKYFARGEYGELHGRPHYHLITFGLSTVVAQIAYDSWDKGIIQMKPIENGTCHYVAGYTHKKLKNRMPAGVTVSEVTSKSGGIGKAFARKVASSLAKQRHWDKSPITRVKVGARWVACGRYIRNKINFFLKLRHGMRYDDFKVFMLEWNYVSYFRQFHGVDYFKSVLSDCANKAEEYLTPKFKVRLKHETF